MAQCSTNAALAHKYVHGECNSAQTPSRNFSFVGDCLYSYETQIACIDRDTETVIMLKSYPTSTTKRHLYELRKALPGYYKIIYSECFDFDDIYDVTVKAIRDLFVEKPKMKSGVLRKKEYREELHNHIHTIKQLDKIDLFIKSHPSFYNFFTINHDYDVTLMVERAEKRRVQQQIIENTYKETKDKVIAWLNGDICDRLLQEFNISSCASLSLYEKQQMYDLVFPKIREAINNNPNIRTHRLPVEMKHSCQQLVVGFLLQKIFNIPDNAGTLDPYDVVWLDKKEKRLSTNRDAFVGIPNAATTHAVIGAIKEYVSSPEDNNLYNKHVGCFKITQMTKDYVRVGCHKFAYNNVKELLKELLQYYKEVKHD